jgi:general nucleoside transport system permease protein
MDLETVWQISASTIRISAPLLLACLAGLWSERSGVVDIGLEGKLLAGAFAAAIIAFESGSAWLGLFGAIVTCFALGLLHGYGSITQRGNQIVIGVAINMLVLGIANVMANAWYGSRQTPSLDGAARFSQIQLPFAAEIGTVPILGDIYAKVISGHHLITYIAFLSVPLTWWALNRTRFGLRLRAVGENPAAVDTAGISVVRLRYAACAIAGLLCALGGAFLSTAAGAGYVTGMSAGRGFIALAALIVAKWRPVPAMLTCLLFGLLESGSVRLEGKDLPVIGAVPSQFIAALPFVLTVILLAGFIGKAIPPKASGIPYVKER